MYCSQKLGEDFAKFCGLLRIYELQQKIYCLKFFDIDLDKTLNIKKAKITSRFEYNLEQSKMAATKAATSRKEEVPLMTKKEKLKYGCFVTMVMLLWVSLAGVSLWSLDLARQSIKIVKDGPQLDPCIPQQKFNSTHTKDPMKFVKISDQVYQPSYSYNS